MPVREYFLEEVAEARRTVYRKYMYDVAVMLGADSDTAQKDVADIMKFEIELAKVSGRRGGGVKDWEIWINKYRKRDWGKPKIEKERQRDNETRRRKRVTKRRQSEREAQTVN